MKFCTRCGNKLSDGFRFCTKCGAQILPVSQVNQMNQMNQEPVMAQPEASKKPELQSYETEAAVFQPVPEVTPAPEVKVIEQPAAPWEQPAPEVKSVEQPVAPWEQPAPEVKSIEQPAAPWEQPAPEVKSIEQPVAPWEQPVPEEIPAPAEESFEQPAAAPWEQPVPEVTPAQASNPWSQPLTEAAPTPEPAPWEQPAPNWEQPLSGQNQQQSANQDSSWNQQSQEQSFHQENSWNQQNSYAGAAAQINPIPINIVPHKLPTNRGLLKYILFSILTCGIYSFFWINNMAKDVNTCCYGDGKDMTEGIENYLLYTMITMGVYGQCWQYEVINRIKANGKRYGVDIDFQGSSFLLWNTVGTLLCGLGPLIGMHKFCKSMNELCEAYNRTYGF